MKIGGFQPSSLCDYPGKIAAVVFTQGCNFRCPFCHNGSLIPTSVGADRSIPTEDMLATLAHRRGKIEGVVVSGGEPTLQKDLAEFLRALRRFGFAIKLDTNGSRPDILQQLLEEDLIDYVAMDIKAPPHAYSSLSGVLAPPTQKIASSIEIISRSGKPHEFRTTMVDPLLSNADLIEIRAMVPGESPWKTQPFRPEHALDPSLRLR